MDASFEIFVERNRDGSPRVITIRLRRNVTNFDRVFTFRMVQEALARNVLRVIRNRFPNRTDAYINTTVTGNNRYLITGFVVGTDVETQGQMVANTHTQGQMVTNTRGQTITRSEDHPRSIRRLLIQTPELFENMVREIVDSGKRRNVEDIEWSFVIDQASMIPGSGNPKVPEWVGARDSLPTWKHHTLNNEPINCAAFALCYAMVHTKRIDAIKERALAMTLNYNWSLEATAQQILNYFTRDFPTFRLTILTAGHDKFDEFTEKGSDFEYVEDNHNPTIACHKKIIYLYHQYGYQSYSAHFALTKHPLKVLQLNANTFMWCHKCVRVYKRSQGLVCLYCNNQDVVPKKKKARLSDDPVQCQFCKETPCNKEKCPRKCNNCKVNLKQGYDLSAGEGHRCIIYASPSVEMLWQPGDWSTNASKAKTQVWIYDFESSIKRIPGTIDSMFVTDAHGFMRNEGDFITSQVERSAHDVNMAVCVNMFDQRQFHVFKEDGSGISPLKQFMTFILSHNFGKNIVIAHNGGGYDTRLIYEYVVNEESGITQKQIKPLINGCKFMELKVGCTRFRDSLLHLTGSLANLAKAFNLTMRKGYFPHLFNTIENQDYVGTIPDERYFDLTFSAKSAEDVQKFKEWHASQRHRTDWSFKEEIKLYCIDDVKILADMCLQYHLENVEKRNLSPWLSITAPGYCHTVIKKELSTDEYLEMPPDTPENDMARRERLDELSRTHWVVLTEGEYWFARLALRGGRTDVRRLTYTLSEEDKALGRRIAYVDVVSMYPSVQVKHEYPVGVPQIMIYDLDYYPCNIHRNPESGNTIILKCECPHETRLRVQNKQMFIYDMTGPSNVVPTAQSIVEDDDFFGLVCVSLTPPTDLFIPVLVTYDHDRGKCQADLTPIIAQVFTSVELKVAFKAGYILDKIHRYDKYNRAPGLWNNFIKKLYIDKMGNSLKKVDGVVQHPSIEKQIELENEYESRFQMGQMVRESFSSWDSNPVKKQVAKIMLNSGWGKHCQRPNLAQSKIIQRNDMDSERDFMQRYDAGYFKISSIIPMKYGTAYEQNDRASSNPNLHDSYIPAGLFVPAYGRLMLYEQMSKLGKRVLYHDTDSIIYIYDPTEDYNIPTSDIWGDWEEEDDSKIGIESFTAIAPKSYGYRLANGKEKTKFKGVSVKHAHKDVINLKTMEDMVAAHWRNEELIVNVPQFGIRFDKKSQMTYTTNTLKKVEFQAESLKGNLHPDGLVYPRGYCPGCQNQSNDNHTCLQNPSF